MQLLTRSRRYERMADLTKMVESFDAWAGGGEDGQEHPLTHILKAMAEQIEANEAEIERLKEEVDRLKWVNDPNL